jgi:hypothetical protein
MYHIISIELKINKTKLKLSDGNNYRLNWLLFVNNLMKK